MAAASQVEVSIRDVEPTDVEVFYQQQLDPEASRRAVFPVRERDRFTAKWKEILADEEILVQTVLVDGEIAGNFVCWQQSGRRWVGYWFGREYWGRGAATRGLKLFLERAPWRPLYADPATRNVGSVRVLEKCGFQVVEKLVRPSLLDGEDVEHVVFALDARQESATPAKK